MKIKKHSLNNQWVKEEIRKKKKLQNSLKDNYEIKHIKMYGMLRGKFIELAVYITKQE